jgi:hypothetical protein
MFPLLKASLEDPACGLPPCSLAPATQVMRPLQCFHIRRAFVEGNIGASCGDAK